LIDLEVRPGGPYSLALSARLANDPTRTFRDGVLRMALEIDRTPESVLAWQRQDGTVVLRAATSAGAERLHWILALDDDHSAFLNIARRDPLLREAAHVMCGLRQIRVATVSHALLRAFCGQLIHWKAARRLEQKLVRALAPPLPGSRLHVAPSRDALASTSPTQLRSLGLHARRAASLVRICRDLDPERLRDAAPDAVAARIGRERGVGPWSVGVVFLEGLGRVDRGLVGDLGLIKLCTALGRDPEDTASLLAPYGEWAGLASRYFLSAFSRGLVPLPNGARVRKRAYRAATA
jgi:3-methyladenine DNA glycosylase/8-oxoguanine DNA glycosylase